MPTHDEHDSIKPHKPTDLHQLETETPGYEVTDVSVSGIVIFLVSLGVFLGVFFVFCFGMGKVINNAISKADGPPNRWNSLTSQPLGKKETMPSSATLQQQQLSQVVQRFPSPRLQTDDGNLEMAEMHAREDLLLDHYSWIDRQGGKVRIPVSRAMELIAQHGLPVTQAQGGQGGAQKGPLMTADSVPVVTVPLTDGFARTGYEQQYRETVDQQRARQEKAGEQAQLAPR